MNKVKIKDRINNIHEIAIEMIDILTDHGMLTEAEKWSSLQALKTNVDEIEKELGTKNDTIYTVTTLRLDGYRSRTPGWFSTFKEAEEIVLNNELNIFENYYHYAVIEAVEAGLYNFGHRDQRIEIWYKWNNEKQSYENILKPKRFLKTVGWSIG